MEIDPNIFEWSSNVKVKILEEKILEPGEIKFVNVSIDSEEILLPVMNFGESKEISKKTSR